MGRGGRKKVEDPDRDGLEPGGTRQHWTDTHPDRHLWSPGRLAQARTQTQEEYEALYGRGSLAPEDRLSSPFFPRLSIDEIEQLRHGTFTGEEAREFLSAMQMPEDLSQEAISALDQDPVLGAFWESELRRMQAEQELFEENGAHHWFRHAAPNLDDIRQAWFSNVVSSWFWRPEQNNFEGWKTPEEAQERMRRLPHSIMAAAIESRKIEEHNLARSLYELRQSNEEVADQLFEETLKPEIDYLTLRSPHYNFSVRPDNSFLGELWHLAARYSTSTYLASAGPISPEQLDIEKNMDQFARLLPEAEGEVFLRSPLVLDRCRAGEDGWQRTKVGIFQEAWAQKGYWDYDPDRDRSLNQSGMIEAANAVLSNHVIRIYSGLGSEEIAFDLDRAFRLRQAQEEAVRSSGNLLRKLTATPVQGSLPLDNLRPIFEKEGALDQFEKMQSNVRRTLADGHSFDPEKVLSPNSNLHGQAGFDFRDLDNASLSRKITARIEKSLQNIFSSVF